jgi:N6-adenosine-specific RNA methylase IME4
MSAPAPFDGLRMFGYNIIHADPPWAFENWSEKGEGRNPNQHYETMPWQAIAGLPVGHLAAGDCACFLWCVDPLLDKGFEVLRAWGFRFVSKGFTWAKRTKNNTGWHMGPGYTTRANDETCLLGMTGNLTRRSAAVRQLVVEPIREHSRKPDRISDDIVRLYGDLPRAELFARVRRPGWDAWGHQVDKFKEAA